MISIIHVWCCVWMLCISSLRTSRFTVYRYSLLTSHVPPIPFIFIPRGFSTCIFIIQKTPIRLSKQLLSDYPNNCQQVISSFKWVFHRSMINGKQICIIVVDLQITNVELRPNENKLCHPSRSHRLSFSPGNRYKIPQIYNSNLFLASRTCFYEIM